MSRLAYADTLRVKEAARDAIYKCSNVVSRPNYSLPSWKRPPTWNQLTTLEQTEKVLDLVRKRLGQEIMDRIQLADLDVEQIITDLLEDAETEAYEERKSEASEEDES